MTRKSKTEKCCATAGVDDRDLPHPHGIAVDPVGGAVFDDASDEPSVVGTETTHAEPEKPTAEGDSDAIGFAVFEDCPDPTEDETFGGGDGVGAVVSDDCDGPADRTAVGQTATAPRPRAATSAGTGMGAAVFPDGRVVGDAGESAEVREGYGLVFF